MKKRVSVGTTCSSDGNLATFILRLYLHITLLHFLVLKCVEWVWYECRNTCAQIFSTVLCATANGWQWFKSIYRLKKLWLNPTRKHCVTTERVWGGGSKNVAGEGEEERALQSTLIQNKLWNTQLSLFVCLFKTRWGTVWEEQPRDWGKGQRQAHCIPCLIPIFTMHCPQVIFLKEIGWWYFIILKFPPIRKNVTINRKLGPKHKGTIHERNTNGQ